MERGGDRLHLAVRLPSLLRRKQLCECVLFALPNKMIHAARSAVIVGMLRYTILQQCSLSLSGSVAAQVVFVRRVISVFFIACNNPGFLSRRYGTSVWRRAPC